MKKNLTKFFKTKAASIDESKFTATFVISDESVDRQGEIIKQDGWDFKNYLANPVVLFGHDSYDLPIGKTIDIKVEDGKTLATIEFAAAIYDKAATVFNMVKAGILNTVSVGFINKEYLDGEDYDNYVLTKNELLEISIVPVPANPNAIVLAAKDGLISKKDVAFLTKAYEKELEGLNKLKDNDNLEDMEQLQQFITDALKPINDKLASVELVLNGDGADNAGLVSAVEDIKTDLVTLQDGIKADDEDGKGDDDDKGDDDADGKDGKKPTGTDDDADAEVDADDLNEEQAQQVADAVAAALEDDSDDNNEQ